MLTWKSRNLPFDEITVQSVKTNLFTNQTYSTLDWLHLLLSIKESRALFFKYTLYWNIQIRCLSVKGNRDYYSFCNETSCALMIHDQQTRVSICCWKWYVISFKMEALWYIYANFSSSEFLIRQHKIMRLHVYAEKFCF